jgi:hypothetical protein
MLEIPIFKISLQISIPVASDIGGPGFCIHTVSTYVTTFHTDTWKNDAMKTTQQH